jgi:hypothetical protein
VGNYPDDIWDSDSFTFQKSASSDGGSWVGDWTNAGEPLAMVLSTAPVDYRLEQNYPNPFNPSTTISFALPEAATVLLNVFDVRGRQVASLVNGRREAGVHEITFEASNLPSGLYLYRLQAGDYTAVQKMVLLK